MCCFDGHCTPVKCTCMYAAEYTGAADVGKVTSELKTKIRTLSDGVLRFSCSACVCVCTVPLIPGHTKRGQTGVRSVIF